MLLFHSCRIQSSLKHFLADAFAFVFACCHSWRRRGARARRHRVATDVLGRLIRGQLICIFTTTTHGWRFFHGLAILILSPGCSHLLPTRLRFGANLVLISFLFHLGYSLLVRTSQTNSLRYKQWLIFLLVVAK